MKLSIVIPALNEEKYLPRLLESIKKQNFSDYEIIVCDGGSSDETLAVAAAAGCRTVKYDEHRHPSWQRNKGAEIAQGEILLFLDADIVLQDNFLEPVMMEFIAKKLGGGGFYIRFNPNKKVYNIYSCLFNFFCFSRQYFAPASVGSGILARRDLHEAIKGFDTEIYLAEDFDYCYRLSRLGKFRMITSQKILHSSRRLEKEGGVIVGLKWGFMALFTLFNFKIKKKIVKYDFGKY